MKSPNTQRDPLEDVYIAALEAAGENDIDIEAFIGYCDFNRISPDNCADAVDGFYEAYIGIYSDWADFAEQLYDDIGLIKEVPLEIRRAIDWHVVAADLSGDFFEVSGYFFRCL